MALLASTGQLVRRLISSGSSGLITGTTSSSLPSSLLGEVVVRVGGTGGFLNNFNTLSVRLLIPCSTFSTSSFTSGRRSSHHHNKNSQCHTFTSIISVSSDSLKSLSSLKLVNNKFEANFSSVSTKTKSNMKDWDANLDPVQKKLLDEECIVLDNYDKVIGHDSKKNCHLITNGDVLLHRAFSVFIFNSKGELLMQQRSKTKITFPLQWTNTCCSHPLFYPDEMVEEEAQGIKTAAKRRLEFELGISPDAINLEDFHYLTRIHYKALSNKTWGEHEIDYILFLQKDLEINPNADEVAEIRYVSLDQIKKMSNVEGVQLTPWFDLIYKTWLPLWWNNLNNLKQFDDHKKIHRM